MFVWKLPYKVSQASPGSHHRKITRVYEMYHPRRVASPNYGHPKPKYIHPIKNPNPAYPHPAHPHPAFSCPAFSCPNPAPSHLSPIRKPMQCQHPPHDRQPDRRLLRPYTLNPVEPPQNILSQHIPVISDPKNQFTPAPLQGNPDPPPNPRIRHRINNKILQHPLHHRYVRIHPGSILTILTSDLTFPPPTPIRLLQRPPFPLSPPVPPPKNKRLPLHLKTRRFHLRQLPNLPHHLLHLSDLSQHNLPILLFLNRTQHPALQAATSPHNPARSPAAFEDHAPYWS